MCKKGTSLRYQKKVIYNGSDVTNYTVVSIPAHICRTSIVVSIEYTMNVYTQMTQNLESMFYGRSEDVETFLSRLLVNVNSF